MWESEREMLDYAAKACGLPVEWNRNWECFSYTKEVDERELIFPWVPQRSDGQAFRLAVDLGFFSEPSMVSKFNEAMYAEDPCAAIRDVIVREAGMVGWEMENGEDQE